MSATGPSGPSTPTTATTGPSSATPVNPSIAAITSDHESSPTSNTNSVNDLSAPAPSHSITQMQAEMNTAVLTCTNCGTTTTPLWRRDEAGNDICNACRLYYMLHGDHRLAEIKRVPSTLSPVVLDMSATSAAVHGSPSTTTTSLLLGAPVNPSFSANSSGYDADHESYSTSNDTNSGTSPLTCSSCGTSETLLWRRDSAGKDLCSACGLYYKLHGWD